MRYFINYLKNKTTVCLLLITIAGCASSPPSKFYLLSPLSDRSNEVQRSADASCVSVGIAPVRLPEYTNRPQIVTRTSQNEVSHSQFNLWAEPLQDTFPRVIAENLTQLICAKRVYLFPWMASIKPDYLVETEVLEMSGDLGTKAYLQVQWTVSKMGKSGEFVQKRSTYIEPVQDQTYGSLVQAFSSMVEQLSRDIATAIEGF